MYILPTRGGVAFSALLLVIAFKGVAWGISLGGFRGGPTFPAMFIGGAAGVLASHLPGMDVTAAVGVGIGAGVVAMLRLPLTAVVLGVLLTDKSGAGAEPVIIVGVVVAYLATVALGKAFGGEPADAAAASSPATTAPS